MQKCLPISKVGMYVVCYGLLFAIDDITKVIVILLAYLKKN